MTNIIVLSGGAPKEVFNALTPAFERSGGHKVAYTFAVTSVITDKLNAGERVDIVVLPDGMLDRLQKAGTLTAAGRVAFGTVSLAAVVREGAPKPDISTPEKFKAALLKAKKVVHSPAGVTPSGTYLAGMIDKLGIADEMAKKTVYRPALAGGVDLVASGEAELGIYPASEVINTKSVAVVGPLPAALQYTIVYGGAVTANSANAKDAAALLAYLSSREHAAAWRHGGFGAV